MEAGREVSGLGNGSNQFNGVDGFGLGGLQINGGYVNGAIGYI